MEPANITAIANDVGTEVIFLRQLIAQARPEDVADRESPPAAARSNIILALEEARKRGLLTVALLGYDGGEILRRGLADFPRRGPLRLHSANSGSAGVHLSRDSRDAGGVWRVAKVELFGAASCPYTREMREWLEWKGTEFVEYDVEADARRSSGCAHLPAASGPCPCWSKTARSYRWVGRAADASWVRIDEVRGRSN